MNQIIQNRVVPVAVIDKLEDAVPLATALLAGGLDVIEVTFRTAAAPDAIRAIAQAHPGMLVGAGTLLEVSQVKQARAAGAKFGVAPGLNATIVKASLDAGLPFVPGVATASDVEHGLELGCKIQKLFPADVLGGVKLLRAFAGPYGHTGVKFIPLGGINAGNMAEYLALPIVAAIGGSWIIDKKLIAEKKWSEITALTKAALAIAQSVKI
ncbi:MAG: bifunctional 4-hydroxy-2-oxoglutarate aldolase/2-dehydro-3-deoxy-phosphogluconate aldolase [Verrucomicrobiota bacterium]|jgi:2-dehydro-3-deoxyphosphogluconate aldolase / (4S)-4-hydroxy-2-oxoglutarate aldolase